MIKRCDAKHTAGGGQDHLHLSVCHLLWHRANMRTDLQGPFLPDIRISLGLRPSCIQPPSILTFFFSGPSAATKVQVWINASTSQSSASGFIFCDAPTVNSNWGMVLSFKIKTVQMTQICSFWKGVGKKKKDIHFLYRTNTSVLTYSPDLKGLGIFTPCCLVRHLHSSILTAECSAKLHVFY